MLSDAPGVLPQADKVLTNGENRCTIWKSFSKRGLGPDSRVVGSTPWVRYHLLARPPTLSSFGCPVLQGGGIRTEDYKVPTNCHKKSKKFSY